MATKSEEETTHKRARRPPATTPEARESQLTSLVYDLVEQRILKGSASSAETVHFLKVGSQDSKLQREKLVRENELLKARVEQLQAMSRSEEMYAKALKAMSIYKGEDESEEDDVF